MLCYEKLINHSLPIEFNTVFTGDAINLCISLVMFINNIKIYILFICPFSQFAYLFK